MKNLLNLKYALLLALSFGVLFTSCEDEEEAPELTKKQKLTGNNWILFEATISPAIDYNYDGLPDEDLMPFFDACDIDDFTDWNSDDSYTIEEGETKCDPNDSDVIEVGTWAFNSDQTIVINTDAAGFAYEQVIQSLSASQLVIVETFEQDDVTYTLTAKYN